MSSRFTTKATIRNFSGTLLKLEHESTSTKTKMSLNLYLPPAIPDPLKKKIPLIIYLSGLTCTGDNCAEKGFLQATASKLNLAIVYPDTSPRGANIAGEDGSWDFGTGAGFYIDATMEPWKENYRMYTYITEELQDALWEQFGDVLDSKRVSIMGHSMGGHGALTIFLKNPGKYRSVSAIAPIANPINCPWGQKAFTGYFGPDDKERWKAHDATELVRNRKEPLDVIIDVGTKDQFWESGQLLEANFEAAAKEGGAYRPEGIVISYHPDYDHSYYFISSVAEKHVKYHAKYLWEDMGPTTF